MFDFNVFSHFVEINDQLVCKSCHSLNVESTVRSDFDYNSAVWFDSVVAHCKSCQFTETVELDQ